MIILKKGFDEAKHPCTQQPPENFLPGSPLPGSMKIPEDPRCSEWPRLLLIHSSSLLEISHKNLGRREGERQRSKEVIWKQQVESARPFSRTPAKLPSACLTGAWPIKPAEM
jgi:hypothetical protein